MEWQLTLEGFLIVVRGPVPFPTGGACCSGLGLTPGAYWDGSAWEMLCSELEDQQVAPPT